MPTAAMWIGARLAAVGIAEGFGASMTLLYGRVGAATQLARRYFRCTESDNGPASGRSNRVRFRFPGVGLLSEKTKRNQNLICWKVPRGGIEPPTPAFSVQCSTD